MPRGAPALALLLVVLLVVAGPVLGSGTAAATQSALTQNAGTQITPTTAPPATAGQPRSIPMPNSGAAPRDSGERGGVLQEAVFFGICGVILGGIGLVWWESRRKRRAQGRLPARR